MCTPGEHSNPNPEQLQQSSTHNNNNSPLFFRHLNFATRLGYSESQVRLALEKLGLDTTSDGLLNELIKLDKLSLCDEDEEEKEEGEEETEELRPIVIDGMNVGRSFTECASFSPSALTHCTSFFLSRGHTHIRIFLPQYIQSDFKNDVELQKLSKHITWTPSRVINGKRQSSYDDRYILKYAEDVDGVVVSNDGYRDLIGEFEKVVKERVLMFTWVAGRFSPPTDPQGRQGPPLELFLTRNNSRKTSLQHLTPCPYGRKCTFGSKCKYFHSKKPVSVSDALRVRMSKSVPLCEQKNEVFRTRSEQPKQEQRRMTHRKLERKLSINPWENNGNGGETLKIAEANEVRQNAHKLNGHNNHHKKTGPSSLDQSEEDNPSLNSRLFFNLCQIFPESQVKAVMTEMPDVKDGSVLAEEICRRFVRK